MHTRRLVRGVLGLGWLGLLGLAAQGCSTEVSDEDGAASNNASTNNNSANNADNIPEIVAECGDGVCHAPEVSPFRQSDERERDQ